MNASVALNEGMYASWIRRSYTVRYASQNLKINQIKKTKRLIQGTNKKG